MRYGQAGDADFALRLGHGQHAVMGLSALMRIVGSYWVSRPMIRAETWALGGRHTGRVLEGARAEARAPDVSYRRAVLLNAVIRSQARSTKARRKQPLRRES